MARSVEQRARRTEELEVLVHGLARDRPLDAARRSCCSATASACRALRNRSADHVPEHLDAVAVDDHDPFHRLGERRRQAVPLHAGSARRQRVASAASRSVAASEGWSLRRGLMRFHSAGDDRRQVTVPSTGDGRRPRRAGRNEEDECGFGSCRATTGSTRSSTTPPRTSPSARGASATCSTTTPTTRASDPATRDVEKLVNLINDCESRGDEITRTILRRLNSSFVTPVRP